MDDIQQKYEDDYVARLIGNGNFPVVASLPAESGVRAAVTMAVQYGSFDGEHHKMWVIDQMVRALTGKDYDALVAEARKGEEGPYTYDWDTGIAP